MHEALLIAAGYSYQLPAELNNMCVGKQLPTHLCRIISQVGRAHFEETCYEMWEDLFTCTDGKETYTECGKTYLRVQTARKRAMKCGKTYLRV